jgi:flagellar motor switch protein FliG
MSNGLSRLTPEQRAAVVLVSLEPEQAKPLAEQLGMPAMRRIRTALQDMPFISQEEVLAAFAEFITQLMSWRNGLRGGERESLDLLTKALGETLVEKIRGPIVYVEPPSDIWAEFGQLDPEIVAEYVDKQHGSVAALMLNRLPVDRIPVVLGLMSPDSAVEAIAQLSRPNDPVPAATAVAERMIKMQLLDGVVDPSSDPKIIMIGETLGTLPRDLRDAALTRLEQQDEIRAAAIRSTLLRIEDLPLRLPTKSVQAVFREVGREILIKGLAAIEGTAPEVSSFLLGNIAQRMADQFREDIAALPEMDDGTKDRAIGGLVREILGLSRRGTVTLNPMPEEE